MQWHERVLRRLKLRDLHILMAVVEMGNMSKAAVQLGVSQPAVSKAIAELEAAIGVRLLDRTGHGAEPTLYGRSLLKWGTTIFDDLRQSIDEIEHLADPTRGELRIGCTEPMAAGFVSTIVDQLSAEYPGVVFNVTQADSATLQNRELQSRNIELAVGRLPDRLPGNETQAEILFQEPIVAVAGVANRWLKKRTITLRELKDEPWIMPPDDAIGRTLLTQAFQASGVDLPVSKVIAFSLQLTLSLLASGRYIGLVPGSMLRFSGERLGIRGLPIEFPFQAGPVGISTLKDRTVSPLANTFIRAARFLAKSLISDPNKTFPQQRVRSGRGKQSP
jgi:DNA-binding transcriptional LysR family regulator